MEIELLLFKIFITFMAAAAVVYIWSVLKEARDNSRDALKIMRRLETKYGRIKKGEKGDPGLPGETMEMCRAHQDMLIEIYHERAAKRAAEARRIESERGRP